MRGSLKKNPDSKIYADGRTYDNKLYTFKEIDYRETWVDLDIIVKKLDKKAMWGNIESNREILNKEGNKILDSNGFEIDENSFIMQDINPAVQAKDGEEQMIPLILDKNGNAGYPSKSLRGLKPDGILTERALASHRGLPGQAPAIDD